MLRKFGRIQVPGNDKSNLNCISDSIKVKLNTEFASRRSVQNS